MYEPKYLGSVGFGRGATKRGPPGPTGTPGANRRHDRVPGGAGRHVGPRTGFNKAVFYTGLVLMCAAGIKIQEVVAVVSARYD